jgi:hypothetical protein
MPDHVRGFMAALAGLAKPNQAYPSTDSFHLSPPANLKLEASPCTTVTDIRRVPASGCTIFHLHFHQFVFSALYSTSTRAEFFVEKMPSKPGATIGLLVKKIGTLSTSLLDSLSKG